MRTRTFLALLCIYSNAIADEFTASSINGSLPISYELSSIEEVVNGSGDADSYGGGEVITRERNHFFGLRFDSDATSVISNDNKIVSTVGKVFSVKDHWSFPVFVGGWHWWNIDTGGVGNGGYGAKGYDGTYAYYTIANPTYELENGRKLGGFVFFAGRDDANYRQYYDRKFWFLEGYLSLSDPELGTLKGGLVNTNFGLDYYLGFVGSAPYFDGFIQDPDYGLSWEKTSNPRENVSINSSYQFFVRDGEWNGGLRNHNSETVAGLHERNTFVTRTTTTFTLEEGETLAIGMSGLVGEIDSRVAGFTGGTRSAWGMHTDYHKGPLNLRGELLQIFGATVPTRFVSGGPSNRITSYSTEAAYTVGPVMYRAMFSQGHDANPNGRQTIWSVGTLTQLTPNVRMFVEYTDWTVDGNGTNSTIPILQGVQTTIHWNY